MSNNVLSEAGEYPQLAKCIFYWLNYHSSVSCSDVLLESAVRFPLAEFIERRLQVPVELETRHPDYDRLRVDFCYCVNGLKRNIELKFLHDYSDREAEFKRFFDDLVRLALLDGTNYFILCGSQSLYHSKILKEQIYFPEKRIPTNWEQRSLERSRFEAIMPLKTKGDYIDFNPHELYEYIGDVKKENTSNRQIPKVLQTIRVQLVAKEDTDVEGSQVVYIWKITKTY